MIAFIEHNINRPHLIYIHPVYDKAERPSERLVRRRLREMTKFMHEHSNANTYWVFSTGLEDDVGYPEFRKRLRIIRASGAISASRSRNGAAVSSDCNRLFMRTSKASPDLCELHGGDSYGATNRMALSLDGVSIASKGYRQSITLRDAKKFVTNNSRAFAIFAWRCGWQGVCDGNPPVRERDYRFSAEDKRIVGRMFDGV